MSDRLLGRITWAHVAGIALGAVIAAVATLIVLWTTPTPWVKP